jgi:protease-4
MKKIGISIAPMMLLAVFGVSMAQETSPIPSYYSHTDFLLTSPGAAGSALGGYVNPAVYGLLPGFESQFFWSDEGAKFSSLNRWGWFMGLPHLGFGLTHQRGTFQTGGAATQKASITDYRIALAGGDKGTTFGLGYSWSKGDVDAYPRDDLFQMGLMQRPFDFLSLGLVGDFALGSSHRTGLIDLALRPLGTPTVTLFGDAELGEKDRLEDARWGVGAAVEFVPGLQLVGKYLNNETFTMGLNFSLGPSTFTAAPHYDDQQKLGYTTYGVRSGYPRPNIIDRYLRNDTRYLSMKLKGTVGYRKYTYFDDQTHTLSDLLGDLDGASEDPRVAGVAVNLSGMRISRVLAWEIRQKLLEVREAGKKVVIFIDRGGMTEYHLASVADRIMMDPEGYLFLPGYRTGITYFRGMLAKLGIGVDVLRFYKYKSAGEMLSREDMSEADREQRQALVDERYSLVRQEVSDSRNIPPEGFDDWINEEFLFYPQKAISEGLVDTLARWVHVEDVIKSLEGEKKGLVGPRKLAVREFPSRIWGSRPRIAVVYGLGFCAMDWGIKARQLEKIFKRLKEDGQVKAVVFRVDSPGGDGMASDVVADALKECAQEKPVIISQGNVAASGGYHISMYGDTIVAAPATVTGSIGVLGAWVWNQGLGSKLGLTSDHVKVGDHAEVDFGIWLPLLGLQLPDRELTTEERAKFEELIRNSYRLFVAKVAQGRGLEEVQVDSVAQGRVWSGVDGKEKGLVDEIGGLDLAIRLAREAAGIGPEEQIEIVELPKKGLFKLNLGGPAVMSINLQDDPTWQYLKLFSEHPGQPLPVLPPEMWME